MPISFFLTNTGSIIRVIFLLCFLSSFANSVQHIQLIINTATMTQDRPINEYENLPVNSPLINLGFHMQRFKREMVLSGEVPEWVLDNLNELLDIVLDSCTKLELKFEYKFSRVSNVLNRITGMDGFIVPFLDGTLPPACCEFKSAEEIDGISRHNMIMCLNGYDIEFDEEETPSLLKSKLRDALGLIGAIDYVYEYSDNWE